MATASIAASIINFLIISPFRFAFLVPL